MLEWDRLRTALVGAAVDAVNTVGEKGWARARKDAPVRSLFSGGRRTLRLRTMTEIAADVGTRNRLGLAGEIFGESKTVQTRTRVTKAGVPVSRTLGNRANRFMASGVPGGDHRVLSPAKLDRLFDRNLEFGLHTRGRYELRNGRARTVETESERASLSGKGEFVTVTRLGGGLRQSIRLHEADADQYPNIKAELHAGNDKIDYADDQELGNRHNPAHPFLRPRLPEWREELPIELRRRLGRIGR